MKRNFIFALSLILILFPSLFFAFHSKKRFQEIKTMERRLMAFQLERQKDGKDFSKSDERLLSKEQIPLFIENLYKLAEDNRLKRHNILGRSDNQSGSTIPKVKSAGKSEAIKVYPLKISIEGDYRNVAEYIRELQNINEMKKIREITIIPEKRHIKAEISLDIFMPGEQNASK